METQTVVREDGGTYIPASKRPDGTWRKARRVKDGYVPQDEVPLYESKGKHFAKSVPDHPIGLSPAAVLKLKEARERQLQEEQQAAHSIPGLDTARAIANLSKSAKKNAKRKEKKQHEEKAPVEQATKAIEKLSVSKEETVVDVAKKIRNLRKKVKEIEALEAKIRSGEVKQPEKDQLEKVAKKESILDEIAELEAGSSS